ncbi:MAG: hypothetical protein AAFX87_10935 [Bacteroidota bacterium]
MKLAKTQHKQILELTTQFGIKPEEVFFVKKKGRIRINLPNREDYFEFFKRKTTTINDDRQWEEHLIFEVNTGADLLTVNSWEQVFESFGKWLENTRQ